MIHRSGPPGKVPSFVTFGVPCQPPGPTVPEPGTRCGLGHGQSRPLEVPARQQRQLNVDDLHDAYMIAALHEQVGFDPGELLVAWSLARDGRRAVA